MNEIDFSLPPGKRFSQHTVRLRGREFRVWEAGSGEPLVWLHGGGGVVLSYALDRLADHYRVLLPEMPGWGPLDEVPTSMVQMSDTMAALLRHQGLSRYHLGGTSLGAAVALHIAFRHGVNLDSLILESPYTLRVGGEDPMHHSPLQLREMAGQGIQEQRHVWLTIAAAPIPAIRRVRTDISQPSLPVRIPRHSLQKLFRETADHVGTHA